MNKDFLILQIQRSGTQSMEYEPPDESEIHIHLLRLKEWSNSFRIPHSKVWEATSQVRSSSTKSDRGGVGVELIRTYSRAIYSGGGRLDPVARSKEFAKNHIHLSLSLVFAPPQWTRGLDSGSTEKRDEREKSDRSDFTLRLTISVRMKERRAAHLDGDIPRWREERTNQRKPIHSKKKRKIWKEKDWFLLFVIH